MLSTCPYLISSWNEINLGASKAMNEIQSLSGLEITKKNHCDGDIFEHSFRLQSLLLSYVFITVIFLHYLGPCMSMFFFYLALVLGNIIMCRLSHI